MEPDPCTIDSFPRNPLNAILQREYKLMLVEDSEDDALLFELALRRGGLHETYKVVRRFPDGAQAIEYFLNHSRTLNPDPLPDILLLDIKLPGADGFDVLGELKALHPRPAIGMYTSSTVPEDMQRAENLGADLFQTKTVHSEELSRFLNFLARIADNRTRENDQT